MPPINVKTGHYDRIKITLNLQQSQLLIWDEHDSPIYQAQMVDYQLNPTPSERAQWVVDIPIDLTVDSLQPKSLLVKFGKETLTNAFSELKLAQFDPEIALSLTKATPITGKIKRINKENTVVIDTYGHEIILNGAQWQY